MVPSEYITSGDYDMEQDISCALLVKEDEPASFQEARTSSKWTKRKEAMDKEYKSLIDNKTWELVPTPNQQKVVASKWVFKIKDGVHANSERIFKARLVAKGFT